MSFPVDLSAQTKMQNKKHTFNYTTCKQNTQHTNKKCLLQHECTAIT